MPWNNPKFWPSIQYPSTQALNLHQKGELPSSKESLAAGYHPKIWRKATAVAPLPTQQTILLKPPNLRRCMKPRRCINGFTVSNKNAEYIKCTANVEGFASFALFTIIPLGIQSAKTQMKVFLLWFGLCEHRVELVYTIICTWCNYRLLLK
jgi:hypothetical protein